MVDDARDAERTGEAQQVGQEAECDAEDKTPAKRFPQGLPDPLRTLGGCPLRPLKKDLKTGTGVTEEKNNMLHRRYYCGEIKQIRTLYHVFCPTCLIYSD